MPRTLRSVIPGVAHHVTQRGNRRQQTFFGDADYRRYVELVAEGSGHAGVQVLAWCLMPNHVHLILVPRNSGGLTAALSVAHQRYTWLVNGRNGWKGHLWQSRFYSCPLDGAHLRAAVRYVELNPVRARLVASPELWHWSSVRGRLTGRGDELVRPERPAPLDDIGDWLAFLAEGLDTDEAERIRTHIASGRALGGEAFLAKVEAHIGRSLRRRPPGRPVVQSCGQDVTQQASSVRQGELP